MVEVRTSRQAIEVLADEGDVMAGTRQDIQVMADFSGTEEVRATRMSVEVLADEGDVMAGTRQDIQVMADFSGTEEVRATRMSVEVLAAPDLALGVSRQDIQVMVDFASPAEVRTTRMAIECLARQGSAGPVEPLPLVDDASIFLHNWASKASLGTSFQTSMSHAPGSGAESRRGLTVKPFRSMDLEWMVCDSLDLEKLERLEVYLRRLTDQSFQVPIYMDQQELAASYVLTDTTIFLRTDRARFFQGQRVGIAQLDADNQVTSHSFHIIESMANDRLTFDAALGVDIFAGSYVFPLMDCDVVLEVTADYTTARVPSVKLSVIEAPGASQLPPIKSDNPSNAPLAHDDRPIWFEEPNWLTSISKGRSRQGTRTDGGRADLVQLEGDRSRQTHSFKIEGDRDAMWDALEFFETRRGMLRSFWHIDQDQYMRTSDIDPTGAFVNVFEVGDLADFQEEFDAVGIVMQDGTYYVREVTNIQAILSVFVITMGTVIGTGLSANDVVRLARARLVRFASDEFQEVWTHTGLMKATVSIVEVLNEQDFPV